MLKLNNGTQLPVELNAHSVSKICRCCHINMLRYDLFSAAKISQILEKPPLFKQLNTLTLRSSRNNQQIESRRPVAGRKHLPLPIPCQNQMSHGIENFNPYRKAGICLQINPVFERIGRSEERRVGKECRSRWGREH